MLEPAATVHCRKKDASLVQRAIQGATKQYNEIGGRDISITVEGTLSDDRRDSSTALPSMHSLTHLLIQCRRC